MASPISRGEAVLASTLPHRVGPDGCILIETSYYTASICPNFIIRPENPDDTPRMRIARKLVYEGSGDVDYSVLKEYQVECHHVYRELLQLQLKRTRDNPPPLCQRVVTVITHHPKKVFIFIIFIAGIIAALIYREV